MSRKNCYRKSKKTSRCDSSSSSSSDEFQGEFELTLTSALPYQTGPPATPPGPNTNSFAAANDFIATPTGFSPDGQLVVYNYAPFCPTPSQIGYVVYKTNNGILTPVLNTPNTVTIQYW